MTLLGKVVRQKIVRLSDCATGRGNNFNFIRMIAASAVLFSHSFALSIGSSDAEPLRETLGTTFGTIAVDVFFITSGFLVTASLLNSGNLLKFFLARFLRIFPALFVAVALTTFVLGAIYTSSPLVEYLSNGRTWRYFARGITLMSGLDYTLPGVFDGNPWKSAVNGSLWTLPFELWMYISLAAIWITARIGSWNRPNQFNFAVLTVAVIACAFFIYVQGTGTDPVFLGKHFAKLLRFICYFFTGAAFYIFRHHILLSSLAAIGFALAIAGSAMIGHAAFAVVYTVSLVYLVLYLAYVPGGSIRNYNNLGDYSYGVYIYAFPVQQAVAATIKSVSPAGMIGISGIITLLLAIASWHLLELRALKLKSLGTNYTRRFLKAILAVRSSA